MPPVAAHDARFPLRAVHRRAPHPVRVRRARSVLANKLAHHVLHRTQRTRTQQRNFFPQPARTRIRSGPPAHTCKCATAATVAATAAETQTIRTVTAAKTRPTSAITVARVSRAKLSQHCHWTTARPHAGANRRICSNSRDTLQWITCTLENHSRAWCPRCLRRQVGRGRILLCIHQIRRSPQRRGQRGAHGSKHTSTTR
mmetsp:Transcript_4790/g.15519  ORF Transcript_4790/g.15519 Transcript_4790/m.15519 type:complete len:200 (-) Transcript_4790:20-619(-)